MLGVSTSTLARWARAGRIAALFTPGGRRRYRPCEVERLLAERAEPAEAQRTAADAVRLYEQGWSIRQVGARFGWDYGHARRVLRERTVLRSRRGSALRPPDDP